MSLVLSKPRKDKSYKFLFENTISGLCLAMPDGSILDCNEKFIKLTKLESIANVLAINLNHYFTDPKKKLFSFTNSNNGNFTRQHYLYLASEKKNSTPFLVTVKFIDLEGDRHFLINVTDINRQDEETNQPQLIDDKDYQIERLKKRLFLSEEKFKKVLELSDSAVCIQNESKILFVNPAWEELTKYSKTEVNYLKPSHFIHPEFKKLANNRFLARLKGKKVPEKYDLRIVTKLSQEIWVNVKVSLVEYESERVLMTTFTDITERKLSQQALRESKKKFQSLFYENNSIMFVIDPKNRNIVDANEAACKFYGYSTLKIKSLNLKDISALSENEIQAQIDAAMNGKREHFFFKHKLSNNEIRDVEVYSGKVEIKETILLYSVVHDITARKKAEEALQESEHKLKQLNAQKDRFFSIIAHDLRGPLGSFMQLTEYIKENYSELTDAEFKKYFNHIYTSAKGTFKLLENLLVWTRSQLGVLDLKPEQINIQKITNETISIYSEGIRSKEIDLHNKVNKKIAAFADKNTVATVIRNLISNAIKFTPKHGDITIDAKEVQLEKDTFIEVTVEDTGLGIPEDKLDKLFSIEENYSTFGTNNEKGTGLGLILCKELVLKNGGDIWVKSTKGEGTKFCFNLPTHAS